MKKYRFKLLAALILSLLCILALSACTKIPDKLSTPSNLQIEKDVILNWDSVEGASGYFVQIDDREPINNGMETRFPLSALETLKESKIKVMAKGDGKNYSDSLWSDELNHTVYPTNGLQFDMIMERPAYSVSVGSAQSEAVIIIPSAYNNIPVTEIEDSAFYNCSNLWSVSIPSSIETIYASGFENCSNLTRVFFGGESNFFSGESSLKNIDDYAFYNCTSLENITIPFSVERIGSSAFALCNNLTNIKLYEVTNYLGDSAFSGCSNLTTVEISDGITFLSEELFFRCKKLAIFVIPSTVTSINASAFAYCSNLTEITIPEKTLSIDNSAFAYCSRLESINILGKLNDIGDSAFAYCGSITSIVLPNTLNSIGKSAFLNCDSLTYAYLPDNLKIIEENAFRNCTSLKSIIIPSNVEDIGANAFMNCIVLQINCRASSLPAQWDENWNSSECPVIWNFTAQS